jgi:hypothetical protein
MATMAFRCGWSGQGDGSRSEEGNVYLMAVVEGHQVAFVALKWGIKSLAALTAIQVMPTVAGCIKFDSVNHVVGVCMSGRLSHCWRVMEKTVERWCKSMGRAGGRLGNSRNRRVSDSL